MNQKGSMFNTSSSSGGPGKATFTFVCEAGGDTVEFTSSTPDPAYSTPLPPSALSGTYTSGPAANSLGQALTLVVDDGAGTIAVPGGDAITVALTVPDPGKSAVDLTLTYTPAGGVAENPAAGAGIPLPVQGSTARVLTLGAAGGTRSICGTFTKS
jgi:hypothetical protein